MNYRFFLVVFFLSIFGLMQPTFVMAADDGPILLDPIVVTPEEDTSDDDAGSGGLVTCDGPHCNFCSFIDMADGLIAWLFGILAAVAAVLFAIAGVRLLTSGGDQSAASAAKDTLTNVVIGFIIMLAAWLIVDTVLKLLTDRGGIDEWGLVSCGGMVLPIEDSKSDVNSLDGGEVEGTPLTINAGQVRSVFSAAGISINKDECTSAAETSCTSVGGFKKETIDRIIEMKDDCGAGCTMTITGAAEAGHAGGSADGTHGGGDKFDLRTDSSVSGYINGAKFSDTNYNGRTGRMNNQVGVFCVLEDSGAPNEHWDCLRTK